MPTTIYPPAASSGSSVPNWQLLQTSSPTGVSTVTFSGLSGYSKYRLLCPSLAINAGAASLLIRCNGDSAGNYSYGQVNYSGTTVSSSNGIGTTAFSVMGGTGFSNASPNSFQLDIENALILAPKYLSGNAQSGTAATTYLINGCVYQTTSLLTSITITNGSGNTYGAGSIYLLGAN